MSLFTPTTGIMGGSLIGASAASLLLLNGEILGFSGLLTSVGLAPRQAMRTSTSHWKLVFLGTFMLATNFYINHVEDATRDHRLETSGEVPISSTVAHILGGFFVGLGTKLGNGCTTGHGVCGIARLSPRSLVAVPIFTLCSAMTAGFINKTTSWASWTAFLRTDTLPPNSKMLGTLVTAGVVGMALLRQTTNDDAKDSNAKKDQQKVYGGALSALLLAAGLSVSGMTKKSKVNDFLDLCALCRSDGKVDATLMAVMGSAILTSWLGYQFVSGYSQIFPQEEDNNSKTSAMLLSRPLLGSGSWCIPTKRTIDGQLMSGAALFGLGWGLTGICPGPALFQAAAGFTQIILAWFPAFYVGSFAGERLKRYLAAERQAQDKAKKEW